MKKLTADRIGAVPLPEWIRYAQKNGEDINIRALRFYYAAAVGVMPRPYFIGGRGALYGLHALSQLKVVRHLQRSGAMLKEIREFLEVFPDEHFGWILDVRPDAMWMRTYVRAARTRYGEWRQANESAIASLGGLLLGEGFDLAALSNSKLSLSELRGEIEQYCFRVAQAATEAAKAWKDPGLQDHLLQIVQMHRSGGHESGGHKDARAAVEGYLRRRFSRPQDTAQGSKARGGPRGAAKS